MNGEHLSCYKNAFHLVVSAKNLETFLHNVPCPQPSRANDSQILLLLLLDTSKIHAQVPSLSHPLSCTLLIPALLPLFWLLEFVTALLPTGSHTSCPPPPPERSSDFSSWLIPVHSSDFSLNVSFSGSLPGRRGLGVLSRPGTLYISYPSSHRSLMCYLI